MDEMRALKHHWESELAEAFQDAVVGLDTDSPDYRKLFDQKTRLGYILDSCVRAAADGDKLGLLLFGANIPPAWRLTPLLRGQPVVLHSGQGVAIAR